jgi:hypothetical protein
MAALDQATAAEELHLQFQKLSRLENGQVPGYHELEAMLKCYGASEVEQRACHELRTFALKRGWWRAFGVPNTGFVTIEDVAHKVTDFHIGLIPPLLQVEDYARALAMCAEPMLQDEAIETAVSIVTRRRQRLTDDKPLILHSLLSESSLNQGVDGGQIRHLITLAELENVTLQIVPEKIGLHPGLSGSMALAEFPGDFYPDQAFTFSMFDMQVHSQDERVTQIRASLESIVKLAASPDETLAILRSWLTN